MGMSGLLKSHVEMLVAIFLFVAAFALCVFGICYWLAVVIFLFVVALMVDNRAKKLLDEQTSYVYGKKQVRNADCLIIGDMVDCANICRADDVAVCIMSPGKSLEASFWILKRMFSILDEEHGKVVIAVKDKNINKRGVSLFEYSFLSPVYRNILNVHYLERQRRHPFFFAPLKSTRLVCGFRHKSEKSDCLDARIADFCQERGIVVEFRLIQ